MTSQPSKTILVFNKFCPYAQRALLTAYEKQIDFEVKKVSLENKSAEFKQIYSKAYGRNLNSDGLVPILMHEGNILAESEPISWYLAETFSSGSNLIPSDPLKRLKMRRFLSTEVGKMIKLFDSAKKQTQITDQFIKVINKTLEQINQAIESPYIMGNNISLADLMIYPWFQRWVVIQTAFGVDLQNQKFTNIQTWLQALTKRSSIHKSRAMTTDQFYLQTMAKMKNRNAQPKL